MRRISRRSLTGAAILSLAFLAASSGPKVELRPMKRVSNLPMGQCDVEVTFRLVVSDGGSEDYYCPEVVWEWEDGSRSVEESDCPPFEEAGDRDHRKTWTRKRPFQRAGSYTVRAHLCKAERRIHTVEATAVVSGWEGYPDNVRGEHGCSPAHRDEPIAGAQEDGPLLGRRPPPASNPCG